MADVSGTTPDQQEKVKSLEESAIYNDQSIDTTSSSMVLASAEDSLSTFSTAGQNEASAMQDSSATNLTKDTDDTSIAKDQSPSIVSANESEGSLKILDEAMTKAVGKMGTSLGDSPRVTKQGGAGIEDDGSLDGEEIVHDEKAPLIKRKKSVSIVEGPTETDALTPKGKAYYKEESLLYIMGYSKKIGYLLVADVKQGSKNYGKVIHTLPLESPNQINNIYFGKRRRCCPKRPTELYLPCIKTGVIYCIDISKPMEPKEKERRYPKDILGPLSVGGGGQSTSGEPDFCPSSISRVGRDKLSISWMSSEFDGRVTVVNTKKLATQRELAIDSSVSCHAVQNNLLITCEGPMRKYFLNEFPLDDELTNVTKTLSPKEFYGNHIHSHYGVHRMTLWDINRDADCPIAEINLRKYGQFPSKICFLNNDVTEGFVICSLSGDVIKFVVTKHVKKINRSRLANLFCNSRCSVTQYGFDARKVLSFPPLVMDGWLPNSRLMPAMTSDLAVSSDNSFIVVSNFLHGEIRIYALPKDSLGFPIPRDELNLGGRGGIGRSKEREPGTDSSVPVVGGKRITGGPARLHLSKDGRRLFVTNSYCNAWDHEFYPNSYEKENFVILVHIDINAKTGNVLRLDKDFMLDFSGSAVGDDFVARCVKGLV